MSKKGNKPAPQFKNVNEPTFNDFVNEIEREREEEERKRIDAASKAIREAYWRNWDKLPSVWVARDDDGSLWIYTTKPVKGGGMFSCSASGDMFQIDDSVYPEITFENSPIRVKLLFIDA
jgi:hypothetical protein